MLPLMVFERYPLSNACGQGGCLIGGSTWYEDLNTCSKEEAFMVCEVDGDMSVVALTHGIFKGVPPPPECFQAPPRALLVCGTHH